MILAFIINGDRAGRWVFRYEIESALIESLQFSQDGAELFSLVRLWADNKQYEKLLVYPWKNFARHHLELGLPVSLRPLEVHWKADTTRTSRNMTVSRKGMMVAICTNLSGSTADIRVLSKRHSQWLNWGVQPVQVFRPNDSQDWHGKGLTGISLYLCTNLMANKSFQNDECLALSLDSPYMKAPDCYRIRFSDAAFNLEPLTQIAQGTANFGIAVSQTYYAIALLDRKGLILGRRDLL